MRSFFHEYGSAILVAIVTMVLIVALGTYNINTKKGTGIAKVSIESTSKTVDTYKKQFFDTKDNRR